VADDLPPPPKSLQVGGRGRKLWRDAVADFGGHAVELELLYQLAVTVDELDKMTADLAEMGMICAGSTGQPKANPLLPAIVAHRKLADQLAVGLGLPVEGEAEGRRRSAAAKQNAETRWRNASRRKGRLSSVHEMTQGKADCEA